MILEAANLMLVIVIIITMTTQVIVPLWKGTPVFWIFRSKAGMKKIQEAKDKIAEAELQRKAKELEEFLEKQTQNQTKETING